MFKLLFSRQVFKNLDKLSDYDYNICLSVLNFLAVDPFPGIGGDKEKLKGKPDRYRIHISRTYSAMYEINKETKEVYIGLFGTIEYIHKHYNTYKPRW